MSISALAALGFVEFLNEAELALLVACDYHLCDALAGFNHERLGREVMSSTPSSPR